MNGAHEDVRPVLKSLELFFARFAIPRPVSFEVQQLLRNFSRLCVDRNFSVGKTNCQDGPIRIAVFRRSDPDRVTLMLANKHECNEQLCSLLVDFV